MIAAILIATVTGLLVNEFCEISPWLARKLVRWSALRRYDGSDRAETRAEELSALISERPGNLLKVITACCFAAGALTSAGRKTALAQGSQLARVTIGIVIALLGAGGLAAGVAIMTSTGMAAAAFTGGACMTLCYASSGVLIAIGCAGRPVWALPCLLACASNVTYYLEGGSTWRLAWAVAWFAGFAAMAAAGLTTRRSKRRFQRLAAEHAALFPDCTECLSTGAAR